MVQLVNDNIHPTALGRTLMADLLASTLHRAEVALYGGKGIAASSRLVSGGFRGGLQAGPAASNVSTAGQYLAQIHSVGCGCTCSIQDALR